jgi:hypothetical protein
LHGVDTNLSLGSSAIREDQETDFLKSATGQPGAQSEGCVEVELAPRLVRREIFVRFGDVVYASACLLHRQQSGCCGRINMQ